MFILNSRNQNYATDFNQIPFDYILTNNFYITCKDVLFDISILSILPKLLKLRFPECKVNIITPTDDYNNFNLIFDDNPWIDSITDNIYHDYYVLDTNVHESHLVNYEESAIKNMLWFWKFEQGIHPEDLIPEIYFNNDDIEYIQELNQSWCNGEEYAMIYTFGSTDFPMDWGQKDKILEMLNYYDIKNIIRFDDGNIYSYLNDGDSYDICYYNELNLDEFIVPDKIKLGLMKFAKLNIFDGSNPLFNLMRKQTNIYHIVSDTTTQNQLKNINYTLT